MTSVAKEMKRNERILCISDMHAPYNHPDTVDFLSDVNKTYKPTRIICLGDEVDKHGLNFHGQDPDLLSAGDELKTAIATLKPLYKLFPKMDIMESNHGSLAFRRAKEAGVPRKYIRDYGEVLEAPKTWVWYYDLLTRLPSGEDCYFHHGISSNILRVVQQRGVCVVQGHYHNSFCIQYASNPRSLLWGMQVGCSISKDALAFAYDRNNLGRPIIGHGIILGGYPELLPMVLGKNGKWKGQVV